jgi:hypothetical protein
MQKHIWFCLLIFSALSNGMEQLSLSRVDQMPNLPEPLHIIDWHQKAIDYDAFVFDFSKTGPYLPLIWTDTSQVNYPIDGFGMPSYVGRDGQSSGTAHESINTMGAVLGATLAGIDKSDQNGTNWVLMLQNYFNQANGEDIYMNNINARTGHTFWYELLPSIIFYQIYFYYPGMGDMDTQFVTTADRWHEACIGMGAGVNPWRVPNFNHTAFSLSTMQPVDNGVWLEPDSSAAIAWIGYMAYIQTGRQKYLDMADWGIQYILSCDESPLYDLLLCYAPYIATRLNLEQGRSYNVQKLLDFCFDGNRHGWGVLAANWGGYDCHGLTSSPSYAFLMETLNFAGAITPLVRYDQRYARAVGKWMLNLANSARLFYPDILPAHKQSSEEWSYIYDPQACIAYEGLKKEKWVYDKTDGENLIKGRLVSGTHMDTHTRNNVCQVLEEVTLPGGKDGLEHIWHISLNQGSYYQIVVKARTEDAGDADEGFNFSYSNSAEGPWTYLFNFNNSGDEFRWKAVNPSSNDFYIKVSDTDKTIGNYLKDRILIDEIYVHTQNSQIAPYASGDPLTWGWGNTDLGLYGSSYVGILGGMIETTNIPGILRIDLLKTDYYRETAYPSYLYYNPYSTAKNIVFDAGTVPIDLYDMVSQKFAAIDAAGQTEFTIEPDSAMVIVHAPAGGQIEDELFQPQSPNVPASQCYRKTIDGIAVDRFANLDLAGNLTPEYCQEIQASAYRLSADTDADCEVGLGDIYRVSYDWLQSGWLSGRVDINKDGYVNNLDMAEIANQWLQTSYSYWQVY